MLFEKLIRPALYRLSSDDAEAVHERTIRVLSAAAPALGVLRRRYGVDDPVTVFGLRFPNRVGLAAGMDKDGRALGAWPSLGFGFVEVGTVTRLAQPGNPKPRLFALPTSDAVINRMGFNNAGADALARKLATEKAHSKPVVVGVSIGKSKVVPLEDAVADYQASLRSLYPYADYFAINVSSPNTPGLRSLQDKSQLAELLDELNGTAASLAGGGTPTPLLVKVAPDLSDTALAEVLEVCDTHGVAGLIATNTTLSREGLAPGDAPTGEEAGGLSGRPLAARAREVVRFVHERTEGKLPIIGVGGIFSGTDARRMLDAGASLVQVYTGFALKGPGLIREINRALAGRRIMGSSGASR
ncbi:MAG TPA: quinone-dependent dihydroorotate dehydrogenase [Amycolatopsis sp.]|uniref:quinone-dependent dihydroorotate dehydrogenase n=1 Tax=Amycolatopsis sp. TaxID=37632 RepID=UPI002B49ED30|nr:quinone-dependent dihydroorotate dehydrogenase [Amycolatopsis sp.]HKS49557.1 quinone-dependent dihydroorotate dehydrogenase [Amycolatopsis sp.]